jgi:hypothetical protein
MRLTIMSFILASDKSYDNNKNHLLMIESAFMTDFVVRKLAKEKFFNCSRINFVCHTNRESMKDQWYVVLGVMMYNIYFDDTYFEKSDKEKTEYLYHLLYSSLEEMCGKLNWDFEKFRMAMEELKDNNFESNFYSKLKAKRGNITARVYCEQKMRVINYYVDFFHKKELISRHHFHQTMSDVIIYTNVLGALEWSNDNQILLHSRIIDRLILIEIPDAIQVTLSKVDV